MVLSIYFGSGSVLVTILHSLSYLLQQSPRVHIPFAFTDEETEAQKTCPCLDGSQAAQLVNAALSESPLSSLQALGRTTLSIPSDVRYNCVNCFGQ